MPSLLPGYEYDIFISYRHNDNLDGWVTDFVQNLEKELKGTLKDNVTIYFDKNPQDGLLELHNVGKSLEGKLKCLIFIPVISQTYCDPKSFAWQQEFCAFNNMAKEDQFGRDIKLVSGNVTSRILPIQIHEIDEEDKAAIEKEIGGVLRMIKFIHKEAGVNRPLRSAEENPGKNQYQILYLNQLNKVANAIKESIFSLVHHPSPSIQAGPLQITRPVNKSRKTWKNYLTAIIPISFIVLTAYYFYPRLVPATKVENAGSKSIAILPFVNMSNDANQDYFSDGMTDQLISSLTKLKHLNVIGSTSMMHYKGSVKSIKEITTELNNVSYILAGSVQKSGNRIKVITKLTRTKDNILQWSEIYDRDLSDIFAVEDELTEKIANALVGKLQPDQMDLLRTDRPATVEAYEYYLKGIHAHLKRFAFSQNRNEFLLAEQMFKKAILLDPNYATAFGALADLYDTFDNTNVQNKPVYRNLRDSLIRIGYSLNPNSEYVLLMMGQQHYDPNNMDSAFYFFKKAYDTNPNNPIVNTEIGNIFCNIGLPDQGVIMLNNVLQNDPINIGARIWLARAQFLLANINAAEENLNKAWEIDKDNVRVNYFFATLWLFYKNDPSKAQGNYQTLLRVSPDNNNTRMVGSWLQAKAGKRNEALRMNKSIGTYSILGMKKEGLAMLDSLASTGNFAGWGYIRMTNDKMLDFVRNEPEFSRILQREKRVFEERNRKFSFLFR